jgi:16S rRNA (guanine527-N7)-methyltransferase
VNLNTDFEPNFARRTQVVLDLGFRQEALADLHRYIELLWQANSELNLISRKMSRTELIDNHLIDCLLPLHKFPTEIVAAADFGSGGGLPAVAYALQFPKVEFHLFEKSVLKQGFLNSCRSIAPNLRVHGIIPPVLPKVDIVMARAFKPLDVILEISASYYRAGGRYFLLKARHEKILEEITAAKLKFPKLSVQIEALTSPVLEVERHLVLC